jgi:hypothetical protein
VNDQKGTGITTRQIRNAPPRAIYLWVDGRTTYAQKLAEHLGRSDISVVSYVWLFHHSVIAGYDVARPIVVDHAVNMTGEEVNVLLRRCLYAYSRQRIIKEAPLWRKALCSFGWHSSWYWVHVKGETLTGTPPDRAICKHCGTQFSKKGRK